MRDKRRKHAIAKLYLAGQTKEQISRTLGMRIEEVNMHVCEMLAEWLGALEILLITECDDLNTNLKESDLLREMGYGEDEGN